MSERIPSVIGDKSHSPICSQRRREYKTSISSQFLAFSYYLAGRNISFLIFPTSTWRELSIKECDRRPHYIVHSFSIQRLDNTSHAESRHCVTHAQFDNQVSERCCPDSPCKFGRARRDCNPHSPSFLIQKAPTGLQESKRGPLAHATTSTSEVLLPTSGLSSTFHLQPSSTCNPSSTCIPSSTTTAATRSTSTEVTRVFKSSTHHFSTIKRRSLNQVYQRYVSFLFSHGVPAQWQ